MVWTSYALFIDEFLFFACGTAIAAGGGLDSYKDEILERALEGEMEYQAGLGLMYWNGDGVTQDFNKAREWLEKAANQGFREAQLFLGGFYVSGRGGVPRDYAIARSLFEKADAQGVALAKVELQALLKKEAVPLNYREALLENIPLGQVQTFRGDVGSLKGSHNTTGLIFTKEKEGFSRDPVHLVFTGKPQIVVGDSVEVIGRYDGVYEYITVMGALNTVPSILVKQYEVIKQRE